MTRIVKDPQERRNEILDTANQLFIEKGYDNTTIADILDRTQIAKGTLYYYFKSKEEIMDEIVERMQNQMLLEANKVAEDSSLTVHEKLLHAIMALNLEDNQGEEILKHIHNPQNVRMQQKQMEAMIQGVTPVLTRIVCEGIEKGIFKTDYPRESVEMLIIYVQVAFNYQQDDSEEGYLQKISAFIYNMERLLNIREGSLAYVAQLFRGNHE